MLWVRNSWNSLRQANPLKYFILAEPSEREMITMRKKAFYNRKFNYDTSWTVCVPTWSRYCATYFEYFNKSQQEHGDQEKVRYKITIHFSAVRSKSWHSKDRIDLSSRQHNWDRDTDSYERYNCLLKGVEWNPSVQKNQISSFGAQKKLCNLRLTEVRTRKAGSRQLNIQVQIVRMVS